MPFHKFYSTIKHIFQYHFLIRKTLSHQEAINKLKDWYDGLDTWFITSSDNVLVEDKVDNTLYGEITYEGMSMLANKLNLSKEDIFYDLGCGLGKLVTYMYLTSPINKSIGIEMVGQRYSVAKLVQEIATAEGFVVPQCKLEFIHNNIRNENFLDATVIFMSSLCFPMELMEELNQKFVKLHKGLRIISLINLPKHPSLALKEISILPMSWNNASNIYYYELI
jgi:SAM-dependent methyltransferase